ncbi:MAG TPA: PrgI family protein, partial [Candidatus Gracilibacteria bacterium]|nr:PrgI family protein [Candidatus Gracilibacteria bacterium]
MQFKVPQNVRREDHIVGPLTLKQMIICAIGGSIAYAIYLSLAPYYIWITWLPPVAIVTIITIAFAFIRPLDLSFTKW